MNIYINRIGNDQSLIESLPEIIKKHILEYKDLNRRLASIYAWHYLANYLESDFNVKLDNKAVFYGDNGKPYLNVKDVYFNISHSHNLIAIIISNQECGIDIQYKTKDLRIARKILSIDETKEFKTKIFKADYLNRKWVTKEAYGKMIGIGLHSFVLKSNLIINNAKKIKDGKDTYYYAYYA